MADPQHENRRRKNIGGVIAAIILVVLVLYLAHLLADNLKQQKCIQEGRRDCVATPQPDQ
ncbi:MAG TPA: hypothetical protein VGM26_03225 [Rhizomicrobium sp.]|jgi:hypothetical protein